MHFHLLAGFARRLSTTIQPSPRLASLARRLSTAVQPSIASTNIEPATTTRLLRFKRLGKPVGVKFRQAFSLADVPLCCAVGASVASFWRGAWYMMDAAVFPDDIYASCAASLVAGFGGFASLHSLLQLSAFHPATLHPAARAVAVWLGSLANVFAWRGTWLAWDIACGTGPAAVPPPATPEERAQVEAQRRLTLQSGALSHVLSLGVLLGAGFLQATMAPPSRIGVLADDVVWIVRRSPYMRDLAMFVRR